MIEVLAGLKTISLMIAAQIFYLCIYSPETLAGWELHKNSSARSPDARKMPVTQLVLLRGYYIFAFAGFLYAANLGVSDALAWIPSDWGGLNEDGQFTNARERLSNIITVMIGIGVAVALARVWRNGLRSKSVE